ncbi:MAG: hypothetical protein CR954_00620 [Candidatus Moraniibacteriota bacterium]|nr:MAG: hypothetical protein CR954_00620 [Candidatus Moranbacteria bacterium]
MSTPWHTADAAAWWGEGYKTPEWVLAHGGTIIHYHIVNTNHADKYKAMMFQNGKYVEVEFGNNEHFDDAINGTYTINFYKCKDSCKHQKFDKKTKIRGNDKKVASLTIEARPGETNYIQFDPKAKTAFVVRRTGSVQENMEKRQEQLFNTQQQRVEEYEGHTVPFHDTAQKAYRFDQMIYLTPDMDFTDFAQKNYDAEIIPAFVLHRYQKHGVEKEK